MTRRQGLNAAERHPLLTHADLCYLLNLSRNTIFNWLRAGKFPGAVKIGRQWRIPESDIEYLLNKDRQQIPQERAK